ncbi:hypothetical protein PsorP6_000632 [Peronosclerospora sorghi]|uniref:Uncharacterized protein n=1 Tax=Peronosclerospora sorghi TaxID=230839 RepID=A0ACC0WSH7_9STRA|nr:hypothetical protein PsorP6_000632 [Peronosclerospora sorghi]
MEFQRTWFLHIKGMVGQEIRKTLTSALLMQESSNEHTIGFLKNRWFSLKELRIQINHPEKDSKRCMYWIEVCVILHNFLIRFGDEWEIDDLDLERGHQSQEMRDIALYRDGQLMKKRVQGDVPFALIGELSSGASFAVFDELSFGVLETEVATEPDIGVIDMPCGNSVVLHENSPSD